MKEEWSTVKEEQSTMKEERSAVKEGRVEAIYSEAAREESGKKR